MPSTNEKQIGGDHYKSEYQHWDWATDLNLHFLPYAATKYLMRYREKNGLQDLDKACHYWAKFQEIYLSGRLPPQAVPQVEQARKCTARFCSVNDIELMVAAILAAISTVAYIEPKVQPMLMDQIAVRLAELRRDYATELEKSHAVEQEAGVGDG